MFINSGNIDIYLASKKEKIPDSPFSKVTDTFSGSSGIHEVFIAVHVQGIEGQGIPDRWLQLFIGRGLFSLKYLNDKEITPHGNAFEADSAELYEGEENRFNSLVRVAKQHIPMDFLYRKNN